MSACAASAIPYPTVFGAEILGLSANLVQNYSKEVSDQYYYNHPSISVKGIDYCNVTVTYTHPGQDDRINVETWLPMNAWNGRLQAVGGGGWIAGRFFLSYTAMAGALAEGYVATTTDGGLGASYVPDPWALESPGNVDLYALQNLASASLNDQVCRHKSSRTSRDCGGLADSSNLSQSSRRTSSPASMDSPPNTRTGAAAPKVAARGSCSPSGIRTRMMALQRQLRLSTGANSSRQPHGRR